MILMILMMILKDMNHYPLGIFPQIILHIHLIVKVIVIMNIIIILLKMTIKIMGQIIMVIVMKWIISIKIKNK